MKEPISDLDIDDNNRKDGIYSMPKSRFAHFTYEDRQKLNSLLNENLSFRKIALILGCSPSSVTNEIKKHRVYKDLSVGTSKRKCFSDRLIKAPFVCNGCDNLGNCKKSKYFYNPDVAYKQYTNDRQIPRCKIFYCDARASQQKGKLEKNHEYIRYFYPKGTSFNDLDQDKLNLMFSHINSVRRKELNNRSPFELLSKAELNDMKKLGYKHISPKDVVLSTKLFKK